MELLSEEFIYQKSSQDLTSLLYEALIDNLHSAIADIKNQGYISANRHLQKANDILHRLGAGLNYEAGIIADQLDALYNYMAGQLIAANRTKDVRMVEGILEIAKKIADAWRTAAKAKPKAAAAQYRKRTGSYEQNVMVLEKELNLVEEGK
ncbi:flagellar export chaperone FliS [Bacillus sp. OG2]|nr:flagellar export chaperone FliS [Bacillus sp. OG2]